MTQTTKTKLTLIALTLAAPMSFAQTAQPSKVIVAYVFPQNRLLQPGEIAANKITRVNYAFANIAGNGRIIEWFQPRQTAANFATSSTLSSNRIPAAHQSWSR